MTGATLCRSFSLAEFRDQYSHQKPYFEYWFGEAVQKSVPTVLHALLVKILLDALESAGYLAGPELELRIDEDWQPKADVAGWTHIQGSYPTEPIEVVAEVLSPNDSVSRVIAKCRQYQRIGIGSIFVFEPELQYAWRWDTDVENLERVSALHLPNGASVSVAELWSALERKLQRQALP